MALSNIITAFLNFLAMLCSIPIIGAGIWLASKTDNHCIHFIRWPVVILGILVFLVALAGFLGAVWHNRRFLAFYLVCMAILIVLLLSVLILSFVVTRKDGSFMVPGRAYKEYRLDWFSGWLRSHVTNSGNWRKVRSCLVEADVCSRFDHKYYISAQLFFIRHLSPIESGCCKPPTICGFNYINPTLWTNPTNPTADGDCYIWSNDTTQLCYGCNACKAGVLGNLRKEWRKANVFLVISIVVLICVYLIGCTALKNARAEDLFRQYKHGPT
ncbi:Tetraspanin-2 [Ranunculus cassubicifolius]